MISSAKSPEPPIAAEGGLAMPERREGDPYRALDDLMAVVEALCPVWPSRDRIIEGRRILM
jgi:hypothetical protein